MLEAEAEERQRRRSAGCAHALTNAADAHYLEQVDAAGDYLQGAVTGVAVTECGNWGDMSPTS